MPFPNPYSFKIVIYVSTYMLKVYMYVCIYIWWKCIHETRKEVSPHICTNIQIRTSIYGYIHVYKETRDDLIYSLYIGASFQPPHTIIHYPPPPTVHPLSSFAGSPIAAVTHTNPLYPLPCWISLCHYLACLEHIVGEMALIYLDNVGI